MNSWTFFQKFLQARKKPPPGCIDICRWLYWKGANGCYNRLLLQLDSFAVNWMYAIVWDSDKLILIAGFLFFFSFFFINGIANAVLSYWVGSGQVLWTCTGRNEMFLPSMSLPVMGEIAGVNIASLGGCLHSLKNRDRWVQGFHDELNGH